MRGVYGAIVVAAAFLVAGRAAAQGNISSQGLGYPVGQLSARAIGLGGAIGEVDPASPRNPAALASWGPSGVLLQYGPEIRRVSAGGVAERTTSLRFPMVGTIAAARRFTVGFGASTLADRSWHTTAPAVYVAGTDTVQAFTDARSNGSLTDIRLASSYVLGRGLFIGLGVHVITGEHRQTVVRTFSRSDFATVQEEERVSYAGSALSGGVQWRAGTAWLLGASGRIGGRITGRDTVETGRATLPSRAGLSVAYGGFSGVLLAVDGAWEGWSNVTGLDLGLTGRNTNEMGIGVEADGPVISGAATKLRLGGQRRTLPFDAGGAKVSERSISGGGTIPIGTIGGFPTALIDVALQRLQRSAGAGVSEGAWIVNIGLAIRP